VLVVAEERLDEGVALGEDSELPGLVKEGVEPVLRRVRGEADLRKEVVLLV
jgi:hypothetical protein